MKAVSKFVNCTVRKLLLYIFLHFFYREFLQTSERNTDRGDAVSFRNKEGAQIEGPLLKHTTHHGNMVSRGLRGWLRKPLFDKSSSRLVNSPEWKKSHPLSERLAPLGIMGNHLSPPLKPINMIVL